MDYHHIIPRKDERCTENNGNIAVLCASCHRLVHSNYYIIEGVYMSTGGMKLFWHKAGDDHIISPGVVFKDDGTVTILK